VGCATNRRENGQGIDLNRDYLNPQAAEVRAQVAWLERQPPFDLTLCLHEDWEAHGFYVYELNPEGNASRAAAMVAAVAAVCPIDRSALIEGRPAQNGVIRAELDPTMRPLWPEAFWLLQHKTRLSYTPEAPSDFPLQMRVNALVTAVQAALADGRAAD
jgi:murein peptide amidase A